MVLLLNNELKEGLPAGVFSAMETICSRALAEHGWPQTAEISLTICDNLRIQALNKEWRGVDAATDVLSFPLITPDEDLTAAEDFLLGDIIISLERAKEQAADYNHSLEREVLYLLPMACCIYWAMIMKKRQRSRQCVWRKRNCCRQ